MDKIFISQLRLETIVGIHPSERSVPQEIVLDIELKTDIQKAAQSDDVADTVDYDALIQQLQKWTSEQQFHLIEALGAYLTEKILSAYPVEAVCLTLHKFPAGLPIASAGVVVKRRRR